MVHIDDFPLLGDAHVTLGIFSSCVDCRPSYLTWIIPPFFPFLSLLVGFDKKNMQVCGDIMGLGLWESFQGPLMRCQVWLLIFFNGIGLLSIEDCAPCVFLGNWALVAPYLCFKFYIFDRLVLEEYVFQVKGGPHLFLSCLHAARDGLPPAVKEMHLFF